MKKIATLLCMTMLMLASFTVISQYPRGDVDMNGQVGISGVTCLIDYLLSGTWEETPVNPNELQTIEFTVNGVSFTMVTVEGGTFMMGATDEQVSDAYDIEMPVHQVNLTSYCIGQTEVTQELWLAVMGNNPSLFSSANGYDTNLQRPVERVSWNDCRQFVRKLKELTGMPFRLPTEAEWEFAARGGRYSQGNKFAGSNTIGDVAWYNGNSYTNGGSSTDYATHAVATKAPNELGLSDMSGNVWEWCNDWLEEYNTDYQLDPTGPAEGGGKVYRGGSFYSSERDCRVSVRFNAPPQSTSGTRGLRLAL